MKKVILASLSIPIIFVCGCSQLQGGRIKRNSDYWNMNSYLQQVGLMPDDWS